MKTLTSSLFLFSLVFAGLHADNPSVVENRHQLFLRQVKEFNGTAEVRPSQVGEKFVAKSVDYFFDGIPSTRMDFEHPSVKMWNGISQQWSVSPVDASFTSISFVHRDFQTTVFSLSLLKKGTYPKSTKTESLIGVAAGLTGKYGSDIQFEAWQDDSYKDPSMPSSFFDFDPKALGFSQTDSSGSVMKHRIYFLTLKEWTLLVEFRTSEAAYDATFPAFDEYISRFVITES
ncbi:MAG: hypothetical protein BWY82_00595 [Verrucomicrobia bacterium ADurb.Bin474]|nr:MAG: hypothetical protein BWY82_00595 [Verrucomicrobia bacterium ADurb.Bin474]